MRKEQLFEKTVSTGNKAIGADMPDPEKVADQGAVAFIWVVAKTVATTLRLFYYKNRIEREGWQKDFSEYAMKKHPDFLEKLTKEKE